MIVEKHMRPRYRATRLVPRCIYDSETGGYDIVVSTQSKWFGTTTAAYRWIAWGFIIRMRDRVFRLYTRDGDTCALCRDDPWDPGPPYPEGEYDSHCRWHDGRWYSRTVTRLAHLIRHWDEAAAKRPEIAALLAKIRRK